MIWFLRAQAVLWWVVLLALVYVVASGWEVKIRFFAPPIEMQQ